MSQSSLSEYIGRRVYWIPVILNYSVWSSLNTDGMERGCCSRKKYRREKEKDNTHTR